MRILIIHHRYFIHGGPERYLFNVIKLLEMHGHTVIVFSVRSKKNEPTVWAKYFINNIDDKDSVVFEQYNKFNLKTLSRIVSRQLYSFEVKKKVKHIIHSEQVDLAYVLQIQNKLSPSVIDACYEMKIPVVHRLSDFHLLCPRGNFYNERLGGICYRCQDDKLLNVIKYRCIKHSLAASLLKFSAFLFHRCTGIYKKIDAFVCTNTFMVQKMVGAGFPDKKVCLIPTFVSIPKNVHKNNSGLKYILYFGRISRLKGVEILLKTYRKICSDSIHNIGLKIVGTVEPGFDLEGILSKLDFSDSYMPDIFQCSDNKILLSIICSSLFVVVPSLSHDNLPNVILESFSLRKTVVAPDIEPFINILGTGENQCGVLFKYGCVQSFAAACMRLIEDKSFRSLLERRAFQKAQNIYCPENHYRLLNNLFITLSKKATVEKKK